MVVDDWDNDVTPAQFATNHFGGASGPLISTALALAPESNSGVGYSLRLTKGSGSLGGYFTFLAGPASISTTTSPTVPPSNVAVPGQYFDTLDAYRGFGGLENRSIDQLRFDIKHGLPASLVMRIELKDSANRIVSATRTMANTAGGWSTVSLSVPGSFSGAAQFNWRQVTHIVFVVEDAANAPNWTFLLDNVRLVDTAGGTYPDLAAMTDPGNGSLLPQYEDGFLDHVRRMTSLFFTDSAGRFTATGGIIQDSTTSTDFLTVGGVGFQLNSYVINAERGYQTRTDAADRTLKVLRALNNLPQGPGTTGINGYQGFFYHFLGIDGLRKQRFGGADTTELSPIDTALAIAGVVTAGQYFDGAAPVEAEIRNLAESIYGRVNWRFMVNDAPGARQNQFFLAWKPETNAPGYQYDHPSRPGRFTGTTTSPLTIDYYTDEGLLIALLAMGSPNPANRLGREVWDAIFRVQDPGATFVRTFPGSLFTYQFASVWLDTDALGTDNHPTKPLDFFQNTRSAIQATRNYTIANTTNRDSWQNGGGAWRWGLSAVPGPFDGYFAEAARPAALNLNGGSPLEVGTASIYGVGSSIAHEPQLALDSLWRSARHEDLNQDGKPELLHGRFGFVDSINLDIADATPRGVGTVIRPTTSGPWANYTGLAIDHGPMLSMIDNYLSDQQLVPRLFMTHPSLRVALNSLFPALPPAVLGGAFPVDLAPNRVTFRFSENVQSSLSTSDLLLENLTAGTTIAPANLSLAWDAATLTAEFRYTGASGGVLPDGDYRATLPAGTVSDPQGNALASSAVVEFHVLAGDANRDRSVNIGDFSILAARFNAPGTFSQGDFNYSGTVEIGDFAILASQFNTQLPAPLGFTSDRPFLPVGAEASKPALTAPLPITPWAVERPIDLLSKFEQGPPGVLT